MLKGFLKSKLTIVLGGLLLFPTAFYLARETYKKNQIDNEITRLEAQIAEVEGKNKDITELINYYKTPEYRERQARSILNLQKEGEFAVALPQAKDTAEITGEEITDGRSNIRKWWDYFFSADKNHEI